MCRAYWPEMFDSAGVEILLSLQQRPQQIPALVAALREGLGGSGPEGFTFDAGEVVERKRQPE